MDIAASAMAAGTHSSGAAPSSRQCREEPEYEYLTSASEISGLHNGDCGGLPPVTCDTVPSRVGFYVGVPGGKVNILGDYSSGHSKQKNCICTCVLFRTVFEIELFHYTVHCTLYRRATRRVLTRVAKCINVDSGIFENVLY
jgi:hypothetical protein